MVNNDKHIRLGQWSTSSYDCACLTAESCQDMVDGSLFSSRGWCPSVGKCYQGASSGPYDGIECPATVEDGQWSTSASDCKCLSSQSCEDMYADGSIFSSRGWYVLPYLYLRIFKLF